MASESCIVGNSLSTAHPDEPIANFCRWKEQALESLSSCLIIATQRSPSGACNSHTRLCWGRAFLLPIPGNGHR